MNQGRTIHCRRCRHYQVTWDPRLPHGCRAFGIRCRFDPCLEVAAVSGQRCRLFAAKPTVRPKRPPQADVDTDVIVV